VFELHAVAFFGRVGAVKVVLRVAIARKLKGEVAGAYGYVIWIPARVGLRRFQIVRRKGSKEHSCLHVARGCCSGCCGVRLDYYLEVGLPPVRTAAADSEAVSLLVDKKKASCAVIGKCSF
jgi:hypothetical protein